MAKPDHTSSSTRGTNRTALIVVSVLALLGLAYAILRVDVLRARIVTLQINSKALTDSNLQLRTQLDELLKTQRSNNTQLDQVQTELGSMNTQLGGLRAGVTPAQQQWARIEAGYLLRLAQDQLQLGHDIGSATQSVVAALTALRNDTDTEAVQRQLTQQLQQLRALPVADYTRSQQQLQQAAQTVAQLPLRARTTVNAEAAQDPFESRLDRGWVKLKRALSSLISIRNTDTPQVLSGEAQLLGQTQLQSLLSQAAMAVRAQDQATYQTALTQAQAIIAMVLDTQDVRVQSLQQQLQQLAQLNIAPALPDLNNSIRVLQRGLPTSLSGQVNSKL